MTYEQIARLAEVSTATVSRVLSGGPAVSDELRERVLAAADQLGYRGNRAARTLRRQKADAIGLIVSDVEYPLFAAIARTVETSAAARGYAVLICNTDEDLGRERFYFDLMIEERVSGVIVAPSVEDAANLRALREAGIPVVTIDRLVRGEDYDAVLLDNDAATNQLLDDLLAHGHRRIAAIMGTTTATSSRERVEAIRRRIDATEGASLVVDEGRLQDTVGVEHTLEVVGEHALSLRMPDGSRPTAFVCANAIMLTSVMSALMNAGTAVPEEAAVVGYDDMPGFGLFATPVTVAAQPTQLLGETATSLLFARIDDPERPATVVRVPPSIRIRRSCGLHQTGRS